MFYFVFSPQIPFLSNNTVFPTYQIQEDHTISKVDARQATRAVLQHDEQYPQWE